MNEDYDDKFSDELMTRASQLEKEIQPGRDLWSGIAEAIAKPTAPVVSPWNRYFAQAAAVTLLVGGSSGITYLAVHDDNQASMQNAPFTTGLTFEPVSASFDSQHALGPDFYDARNFLESRLEDELERMAPEARAEVEASMNTIRVAIADINRALANEPNNTLLQKLLLSSYQEELSVMRKVNGLTSTVMFREDI
jgi:hypothetical protein